MTENIPEWRDELLYEEYTKKRGFAAGKARALLIAAALGITGVALTLLAILASGGGSGPAPADSGDTAANDGGSSGVVPATDDPRSEPEKRDPGAAEATPTPPRGLDEGAGSRPADADPELEPERFILPLREWTAIGDRFGEARADNRVHLGLDFILTGHTGAPVFAACSGTVTAISSSPTLGQFIVIDCGAGWTVVNGFVGAPQVQARDGVERGVTVIAYSNPEDSPFGEHLHFEIRWRGVPVDPEKLLDLTGISYTPTPTPTPEPSPSPSPSPTATVPQGGGQPGGGSSDPGNGTAQPTAPATATPEPPTPTPTHTPEPTPTPTHTPEPTPTPTRTPPPPPPTPTPRPRI